MRLNESVFVTFNTLPGSVLQGRSDIEFSVLRLDLCTQWAMGNKYFKLKKNLRQLVSNNRRRVLSFGGAWSNHLLALAQTAELEGIQSFGIVRGEERVDNKMLRRMRSHGMQLQYVTRAAYRLRHDREFCERLCRQYGCDSWLPEGGANRLAVNGCEGIAQLVNEQQSVPQVQSMSPGRATRLIVAVGTGATFAGIVRGCEPQQTVTGVQVVDDSSVGERIGDWIGESADMASWSLVQNTRAGAYANPSTQMLDFIVSIFKHTGIPLDPVYTGPALAVALSSEFLDTLDSGERVVFIHTGGLAGAEGFRVRCNQCADQSGVKNYFAYIDTLMDH